MKKYFIQFNWLLILIYNFSLFYIRSYIEEYFLFINTLIVIFTFLHLFLLNIFINSKISLIEKKKKYNLSSIFITYLVLFNGIINIFYFINFKINFILFILCFFILWIYIIKNIEKFTNKQIPIIYNHNQFSSIYYKLIADNEIKYLSHINIFILPFNLIIEHLYISNRHILISILLSIILIIIARIINRIYKKIKKNTLEKIYHIINDYNPNFIIHFSGNRNSTFQLNQWLAVFESLNDKFIILVRELHHYKNIQNIDIPILYISDTLGVEKIASIQSVKGALYTTNVGKNIHLIRSNKIKHVFIGHGDSDKSSSANNIMKIYDHMFVAGDAHIDRLKNSNIKVPNNYFFKIGRPQLEVYNKDLIDNLNKNNKKIRILYAPTWEGYYKDSSYTSLKNIDLMIKEILKNDKIEFNFKPHPLTGTIDKDLEKISKMLTSKSAYHYNSLYEYFNNIDVLIADISSVVSDALYFNLPIILYRPDFIKNIKKEIPISKCTYIIDDEIKNLNKIINDITQNDYLCKEREIMKKYIMGDNSSSIDKFKDALAKI